MTSEEQQDTAPDHQGKADRRKLDDRRVTRAEISKDGTVEAGNYIGPDRRTGEERRSYQAQRKARITREKINFINHTTVSVAIVAALVLYALIFLLAPELQEIKAQEDRVQQMEVQIAAMNKEIAAFNAATLAAERKAAAHHSSLGNALNRKIGEVEDATREATETAKAVASAVVRQAAPAAGVDDLLQLLTGMQKLGRTDEGSAAMAHAVAVLRGTVAGSVGDASGYNAAIDAARRKDATLGALFSRIEANHLAAAALLLSLDDMRRRIVREESFADALSVAGMMAGRDPVLRDALARLAPYAASGIAGRGALQQQLAALAVDIVMAEQEQNGGNDGTLKGKAIQSLKDFVRVRPEGDPGGTGTAAVVARAQESLVTGDVRSALTEMQTLEGPSAIAALPWITAANGYVAAEDSSDILAQTILQALSAAATQQDFSLANLVEIFKSNIPVPAQQGGGESIFLSPDPSGEEGSILDGAQNLPTYQ